MEADVHRQARDQRLSELMRLAQAGDQVAYEDLLEAVRVILLVYTRSALRRMGRADESLADDLVQEILLALHRKRHTYDPAQPFLPWLLAIARYKLIDSWRAKRRQPATVDVADIDALGQAPLLHDDALSGLDVERLLRDLPERSRKLIELVKLEGLSIAEAAALANMTPSAVKVAIHRALKTLRAKLARDEGGKGS